MYRAIGDLIRYTTSCVIDLRPYPHRDTNQLVGIRDLIFGLTCVVFVLSDVVTIFTIIGVKLTRRKASCYGYGRSFLIPRV